MSLKAKPALRSPSARFFYGVPKACWYVFLGYIALCVVLNVAVAPFVEFRYRWTLAPANILFLVGAIGVGILCCKGVRSVHLALPRSPFLRVHGFAVFVALGSVVLLVLQALILAGAFYLEGDADWTIMLMLDDEQLLRGYYSAIPNNYFLGSIFYLMGQACAAVGFENVGLVAAAGGCVCVTASCAMTAFVARRIGGSKCGACTFGLLFVFVGLSPHVMVPYSDTYAMVFTCGILCLYACVKHPAKWPLMTLVAAVGYHVKPTVLAIFGAVLLVSACLWLARRGQAEPSVAPRSKVPAFAGALACSVLAVVVGFGAVAAVEAPMGIERNPERELVSAHYLMMGANPEFDGTFNSGDRSFSWEHPAPDEMAAADVQQWKNRLSAMGPDGTLALLVRKNLINYSNGDAMFGRLWTNADGEYFGNNPGLMAFYGIEEPAVGAERSFGNDQVTPWQCVAQLLWFLVLVGIVLGALRRQPTAPELAMALALLLLSGFLLIFESSARYLFLYLPFYGVLGVRGWQALVQYRARLRLGAASV